MNRQYFNEDNDSLRSEPKNFKFNFRDHSFNFTTDVGVFSKSYIDFGSFTMLESFTEPQISGPILDLGCGYGPIGIVLSVILGREFYLVDINERAVRLAHENAKKNGASKVQVLKSDSFTGLIDLKFASIILNPPIRAGKKVIYEMYQEAKNHLLPEGSLWIVIQKKQGAGSTIEKLQEIYGNCLVVNKKKGYNILKSLNIA